MSFIPDVVLTLFNQYHNDYVLRLGQFELTKIVNIHSILNSYAVCQPAIYHGKLGYIYMRTKLFVSVPICRMTSQDPGSDRHAG